MFTLDVIFYILLVHLVADFFFQSQKMAEEKHDSGKILVLHVFIYFLSLWMISPLIFQDLSGQVTFHRFL